MKIFLFVFGFLSLQASSYGLNNTRTSRFCMTQIRHTFIYTGSIFDTKFCSNQTYTPGYQIEFQEECLVEPENEDISYQDSVWTYYKCIVTKSLGSTPFTLATYAEMMTRNMSVSFKLAILAILNDTGTQNQSRLISDSEVMSDILELQTLEKFWNTYFDAEYQVCTNSSMDRCADDMLKWKLKWAPVDQCNEREIPKIDKLYRSYSYIESVNCTSAMRKRHRCNRRSFSAVNGAMNAWCHSVTLQLLSKEQDENLIVDFVSIYNKLMTRSFYSKSVKREVFRQLRKTFSQTYLKQNETILQSENVKDIFSYAVQHLDVQLAEEGHDQKNLVFLTNGKILNTLLEFQSHLHETLCDSHL